MSRIASLGIPAESRTSLRTVTEDAGFLSAAVFIASLPYLGGLGLYGDDWAFLADLHHSGGPIWKLYDALMPHGLDTRPVQALVLAGLYWFFGLEPLGYHLFNTTVLALCGVLLYLTLRGLGLSRILAFTIPLVFTLLPHYSTDRVWIAAFQATVSVCLYLLSLYADLRFALQASMSRWLWKGLGTIALVGSVLAYEVTAGLLLLNVLILFFVVRARSNRSLYLRPYLTLAVLATNVLVLALAIGYKLTTTVRADVSGAYVWRALRIVREAVPVHFGEYGIALPVRVVQVLRDYSDPLPILVSLVLGLAVAAYVFSRVRTTAPQYNSRIAWSLVMVVGGGLFVAGYAVTLMTFEIGFHATGGNNRTAIAAAIGVSWVFVGAIGWASSWMPSNRLRWMTLSALAGLLVASSVLVTNAVGKFWVSAYERERLVMDSIRGQFPNMESGTTLLLDGLCPFEGPATVFVTDWDVTGVLWLMYGDRTLRGDVVKPNTEVTLSGIRTMFFDDVINLYPYQEGLVAYHLQTGQATRMTDFETARLYFEGVSASARPACPPYTDGDGANIF